jgi:hypothetical protein
MFAVAGSRAGATQGGVVQGRSTPQQWDVQETRVRGQFMYV